MAKKSIKLDELKSIVQSEMVKYLEEEDTCWKCCQKDCNCGTTPKKIDELLGLVNSYTPSKLKQIAKKNNNDITITDQNGKVYMLAGRFEDCIKNNGNITVLPYGSNDNIEIKNTDIFYITGPDGKIISESYITPPSGKIKGDIPEPPKGKGKSITGKKKDIADDIDEPSTGFVGRRKANTGKQHAITSYDDLWEEKNGKKIIKKSKLREFVHKLVEEELNSSASSVNDPFPGPGKRTIYYKLKNGKILSVEVKEIGKVNPTREVLLNVDGKNVDFSDMEILMKAKDRIELRNLLDNIDSANSDSEYENLSKNISVKEENSTINIPGPIKRLAKLSNKMVDNYGKDGKVDKTDAEASVMDAEFILDKYVK